MLSVRFQQLQTLRWYMYVLTTSSPTTSMTGFVERCRIAPGVMPWHFEIVILQDFYEVQHRTTWSITYACEPASSHHVRESTVEPRVFMSFPASGQALVGRSLSVDAGNVKTEKESHSP